MSEPPRLDPRPHAGTKRGIDSDRGERIAFKEWASVVIALERGLQTVILRRGGIDEDGDAFEPKHREMLLFPTYFHQQGDHLRPEYQSLVEEAFRAEPPAGRLVISSRARVTRVEAIPDESTLDALASRHVYTREHVLDRLHGRFGQVLYALEVVVERLPTPLHLELRPEYGGCRSWVELTL